MTFSDNVIDSTDPRGGACISGSDFAETGYTDKMRLKVTSCTFLRNKAQFGAAIYWPGSALIITDSKFEENENSSADWYDGGGTIYFYYNLDTRIDDEIIIGEFS